ncbi:Glutaredoxin-related protein 5, mitochondrial [Microtus ochrogaster]|uniref:Glutaredoxin-related protein 5, mitochondrial n=1 Tax=Microtus ochrogaster TaxID=79684 RepID=A0A8J6GV22_MICOH|nr:Glutaredoxin-related protein 5, mitochondrial [Microtus ochrogaster]
MSASVSRAAAALLRWGRGAVVGGRLPGVGVRAASSGGQAEQLDALVKKDKVVVFLKGTPEQPQCGFSNAVVQILRLHGVRDYAAYNVLDDPELRQGQARGIQRRGLSRSLEEWGFASPSPRGELSRAASVEGDQ